MAEGTAHWHLDRRVSLGHLVTTATFLLAMLLWGARLETRIALMEETQARQVAVDSRQDAETRRMREEIRDELRRLNEKLDRIYESPGRRGAGPGRRPAEWPAAPRADAAGRAGGRT